MRLAIGALLLLLALAGASASDAVSIALRVELDETQQCLGTRAPLWWQALVDAAGAQVPALARSVSLFVAGVRARRAAGDAFLTATGARAPAAQPAHDEETRACLLVAHKMGVASASIDAETEAMLMAADA